MDFLRNFMIVAFAIVGIFMLMGEMAGHFYRVLEGSEEADTVATEGDIAMIAVAVIASAVIIIVCWVGYKLLELQSRKYIRRLIKVDADHQKNCSPESTEQERRTDNPEEEGHPPAHLQ